MNWPRTRAEAEAMRYRAWAGNSKGDAFNPNYCAAEVPDYGRSVLFHQCYRKPGKGPDGLYCGTHAKRFGEKP